MTHKSAPERNDMRPAAPPTRIPALQNPLDRAIYHPLGHRLARALSKTAITPNMVSVAGGVVVVLAGLAYIQPGWPQSVFAGLLLHMSWHVLDGADGDLARLTGRSSPSGEVVDGVCDYVSHVILYLTLAGAWLDRTGWWIFAAAVAAGGSRVLQANFYEVRRRQFMAWAYGIPWLRSASTNGSLPFGPLARTYLRLAAIIAPDSERIDRLLADPDQKERVRKALIRTGPSRLAGGAVLGANYRTLALGVSMLAGSPLWYFLYEIVVLNIVLVVGVVRSRRALAAIDL